MTENDYAQLQAMGQQQRDAGIADPVRLRDGMHVHVTVEGTGLVNEPGIVIEAGNDGARVMLNDGYKSWFKRGEIDVPTGTIICTRCEGRGMLWNVDAGFRCKRCNGNGRVPAPVEALTTDTPPDALAAALSKVERQRDELTAIVDANERMNDALHHIKKRADDLFPHTSGAFEAFLRWLKNITDEALKGSKS